MSPGTGPHATALHHLCPVGMTRHLSCALLLTCPKGMFAPQEMQGDLWGGRGKVPPGWAQFPERWHVEWLLAVFTVKIIAVNNVSISSTWLPGPLLPEPRQNYQLPTHEWEWACVQSHYLGLRFFQFLAMIRLQLEFVFLSRHNVYQSLVML